MKLSEATTLWTRHATVASAFRTAANTKVRKEFTVPQLFLDLMLISLTDRARYRHSRSISSFSSLLFSREFHLHIRSTASDLDRNSRHNERCRLRHTENTADELKIINFGASNLSSPTTADVMVSVTVPTLMTLVCGTGICFS